MTVPAPCEVALEYLARHHVMTIATIGDAGPAAAAVFYAQIGLDLCFLSSPTTQHARNLASRPDVAVTIQDQDTDWRRIRGIQLVGVGEVLDGVEEGSARDAFQARFPAVLGPGSLSGAVAQALIGVRWYRVHVHHLRLIDNSKGLGHAVELTRADLLACSAGEDRAE